MPLIETEQQRMIAAPFIHLNGSSAKRLAEGYEKVVDLLRQAQVAMSEVAPNQRDYYPELVSHFETARRQYMERVNAISQAIADYEALRYHAEGEQ